MPHQKSVRGAEEPQVNTHVPEAHMERLDGRQCAKDWLLMRLELSTPARGGEPGKPLPGSPQAKC